MYNNITGGSAYPNFILIPFNEHTAKLILTNDSRFPLYEIIVQVVDYTKTKENPNPNFELAFNNSEPIHYGSIGGRMVTQPKHIKLDFTGEYKSFQIYSSARKKWNIPPSDKVL